MSSGSGLPLFWVWARGDCCSSPPLSVKKKNFQLQDDTRSDTTPTKVTGDCEDWDIPWTYAIEDPSIFPKEESLKAQRIAMDKLQLIPNDQETVFAHTHWVTLLKSTDKRDQTDGISALGPLLCGLFVMILSVLCWPLPALLFYYCTTCDKEFHGDCRVLVGLDIPVAPAPMSNMAYIDERRAQARARREEMSAHCPLPTVLLKLVAGYVAELSYGLTSLLFFSRACARIPLRFILCFHTFSCIANRGKESDCGSSPIRGSRTHSGA
jgi:hypothetical protein